MDAINSNDASNASGTSNSGGGNNTWDVSNSRNNGSNIQDDSYSRIVSKAACKSRVPATAVPLQQQGSCNRRAPSTTGLL